MDRNLRKMRKELRTLVQEQKRLELELAQERKKAPAAGLSPRKTAR